MSLPHSSRHDKHPDRDSTQGDYFIDMIEELAERARALGETEVALLLEATAEARRHSLSRLDEHAID